MKPIAFVIAALLALPARGQHEHHQPHEQHAAAEPSAQAGLPDEREGSGTSWMPDSSPMFAHHFNASDWTLMLHYSAVGAFDNQWSDRGSRRFLSTNWFMGMASHPLLGGRFAFRAMLSLEAATAGGSLAIPLLLQSGETYGGEPLHDRQHPHDLFMEVAAMYRFQLSDAFGFELYGAPSGEPALGPVAFMHRPSALNNPVPPIAHHWEDSTHISFGVLTAGVFNKWLKLEGSLFHGREPDENRWDFDLGALDSWSVRLSANPTPQTSLQVSYGRLHSPEALQPDEDLERVTASAMWVAPLANGGSLALTGIWGRNITHDASSDGFTAEAQADLDGKNVPFARLEWVNKLGHDLVVPGDPEAKYGVGTAAIGYVRRFGQIGPLVPSVGAAINVGYVPNEIEAAYGTRVPVGAFVFVGLQPPRMQMGHASARP
ncbi:MAG: hypothetical protein ACJ79V_24795 [Myxococcales bacterium]